MYCKAELSFKQLFIRFDLKIAASKKLNENHFLCIFLVSTSISFNRNAEESVKLFFTLIQRDAFL